MMLGFGITESQEQEKIKKLIMSTLLDNGDVRAVSKAWNKERDKYDKMPKDKAPQRYTKFWVYGGAIHYMHINRRYAFSEDGWGCLTVEEKLPEEPRDFDPMDEVDDGRES